MGVPRRSSGSGRCGWRAGDWRDIEGLTSGARMTAVSAQLGPTGKIRPDAPEASRIRVRASRSSSAVALHKALKGGGMPVFRMTMVAAIVTTALLVAPLHRHTRHRAERSG